MSVQLYGGNKYLDLKWWTFPGGERNVKILDTNEIRRFHNFTVHVDFRNSDDMIDMLLLVNACRYVMKGAGLRLRIPYFPAARQDRVMTEGEPFALQVMVNLIKSCDFYEIEVWDPHSDVLAGMFDPGVLLVKPQHDLAFEYLSKYKDRSDVFLVSPDAGALKKIYKLAQKLNLPVLEATKVRDVSTGKIVETRIQENYDANHSVFVVIDDILDYGNTFLELAKVVKQKYSVKSLELYITHGIFSGGFDTFEKVYDVVYVQNLINKLNIKELPSFLNSSQNAKI